MQIRRVPAARKLADIAPATIVELERRLGTAGANLKVERYDSDLNQVLVTKAGGVQLRIVVDRGQWFVTLASPDSEGEYTAAIWRVSVQGGEVRDPSHQTFSQADLDWLSVVIDGDKPVPVDAHKLRALQQDSTA